MKHLCQIDSIVDNLIIESNYTNPIQALKHSLNIPYYTTCPNMTTQNSCEALNENE